MTKKAAISTIKLYQKTISPDHGVFSGGKQRICRFHPTCSEYTIDAINKYGVFKGSVRGAWRIMRCNPFSKGGFDPVK